MAVEGTDDGMDEAVGDGAAEGAVPAAERYRIDVTPPSTGSVVRRAAVLLAVAAATAGAAPSNPGGGRGRIIDLRTGECVRNLTEWIGDLPGGEIHDALEDLSRLTAREFAARWIG